MIFNSIQALIIVTMNISIFSFEFTIDIITNQFTGIQQYTQSVIDIFFIMNYYNYNTTLIID